MSAALQAPRGIASLDALRALVGQEVAVSNWMEVDAQRVADFASATGDRQWIHLDAERCARESPFGRPVAHGFLTLSLLQSLMVDAIELPPASLEVNYGLDRLRFTAPVLVGDRIRCRFALAALDDIEGGSRMHWKVAMERESDGRTVCALEPIFLRYA